MTFPDTRSHRSVRFAEGVFAHMPPALQQGLKRGGSYLLPLTAQRIPVVSLRGTARPVGRPATMLVAGAEHWVSYLASRFFGDAPKREIVGQAPVWALSRVLRRLRPSADLTLAHVDRLSAQLYFDDDYLTVPDWIGAWLPMPVDLARLARIGNSVAAAITRVLRPAVRRYANAMRESTGHNRYMTPLRSCSLPAAVGSIAIISASP